MDTDGGRKGEEAGNEFEPMNSGKNNGEDKLRKGDGFPVGAPAGRAGSEGRIEQPPRSTSAASVPGMGMNSSTERRRPEVVTTTVVKDKAGSARNSAERSP